MVVFDTESLLLFYLDEEGAPVVEEWLGRVIQGAVQGWLSVVNLTELYYILYRRDAAIAEEKIRNLNAYGLQIVQPQDAIWRKAGVIKAMHAIPLADAFAAATAQVKEDQLLVGRDDDFDDLDVPLIRVR